MKCHQSVWYEEEISFPSNHIHRQGPAGTAGEVLSGVFHRGEKDKVQETQHGGDSKNIMLMLPQWANRHDPELKGQIINSGVLGYLLWLLSPQEEKRKESLLCLCFTRQIRKA